MTKKNNNDSEYQKFSNLADRLLSVPHDEVKAKLEAEKQASASPALVVSPGLPQWNAQVMYMVEGAVRERVPFSGLAEQFSDLTENTFQHGESP